MKCKSLIAMLSVSTILVACGGGGGGSGNVPVTSLPSNPVIKPDDSVNNQTQVQDISKISRRLVSDSSGLAQKINETEGLDTTELYANTETGAQAKTKAKMMRSARSLFSFGKEYACKTIEDCNQQLINSTGTFFIDKDFDNATTTEVRNALLLAGVSRSELKEIWDNLDGLIKFIEEHPTIIRNGLNQIYNSFAKTTREDIKLSFVESEAKQDSYVNFEINDNDDIEAIKLVIDSSSQEKQEHSLSRDGDKNKFDETTNYFVYGMRVGTDCSKGACATEQGHSIEVASKTELTTAEVREKLLALFEEEYNNGGFKSLHGGTDNGSYKEGDDQLFYNHTVNLIKNLSTEELGRTDMDNTKEDHAYTAKVSYTQSSDYKSAATDMKLAYSDFGMMTFTTTEKYENRDKEEKSIETMVFAGGYESKKIDSKLLSGEMVFKGKAVGAVNFHESDNWISEKNVEAGTLLLTSDTPQNAQLNFNSGEETLVANFNNWYDVTMTKKVGEDNRDLKFENGDKDDFGKGYTVAEGVDANTVSSDDFKFRGQSEYTITNFMGEQMILADGPNHVVAGQGSSGVTGTSEGSANIGYYGNVNLKNPTEATGYISYGEGIPLAGVDRVKDLNVQIGFGLKKQ